MTPKDDRAVMDGSYCDMKLVKTRGVFQVVIELPAEKAQEFIRMFGVPVPGVETPVVIARLDVAAVAKHAESTETIDGDTAGTPESEAQVAVATVRSATSVATRCAIACGERSFQNWALRERGLDQFTRPARPQDETAAWVRERCNIKSRKELDGSFEAACLWEGIFSKWQAAVVLGGIDRTKPKARAR